MNPLIGCPNPASATVAVHYQGVPVSRSALAIGLLLSLAFHVAVLFGLTPARPPIRRIVPDDTPLIPITVFNLKDLEEPDPMPKGDDPAAAEQPTLVPALADTPAAPRPDDFVQPLDLSSLIERPSAEAKLTVVPSTLTRSPGRPGEPVFNPRDLDRTPVALAQPPPTYPHALRRDALTATVTVGFIVTASGVVVDAHVIDSTHPGFNDAAIAGVSKWKFRPGMRSGTNVNTRMLVPIVFQLKD